MEIERIKLAAWINCFAALIVIVSLFLPWVDWDGTLVKGIVMATGDFFKISDEKFGVANPLPQFSFLFYTFWLIPVLCTLTIILAITRKPKPLVSFIAASLSLALITAFLLFSNTLIDLGAGERLTTMLKPALYIQAGAAILLTATANPVKNKSWKIAWLLVGPVLAFSSFKLAEKYVMGETHQQTTQVNADYSLTADQLINEFIKNDTAANRKYSEKMIIVRGKAEAVEFLADSSSSIKFADSTGSYAIFSFEKDQAPAAASIVAGEEISVKGVCSGSIFSEILGTTSISFKRSTLIKK